MWNILLLRTTDLQRFNQGHCISQRQLSFFFFLRVMNIFILYIFFLFTGPPAAYGSSPVRVKSVMQLQATPQPQQHQIQAASATYITACVNAWSLTHWERPGIEPSSSRRLFWVLYWLNHNRNFLYIYLFIYLCLLRLHLQHMGDPRLGIQLELQLLSYATATATLDPSQVFDLHHSSRQCWILNPLSEARDQTCIFMDAI